MVAGLLSRFLKSGFNSPGPTSFPDTQFQCLAVLKTEAGSQLTPNDLDLMENDVDGGLAEVRTVSTDPLKHWSLFCMVLTKLKISKPCLKK